MITQTTIPQALTIPDEIYQKCWLKTPPKNSIKNTHTLGGDETSTNK